MQISERRSRKGPGKAGFSLIELMIVIGIIAILGTIALQFNPNEQVAKSKSRRLAAAVMTMFDAPKLDALTGRAVNVGSIATGTFVNPSFIRVSIATGSIATTYYSGAYSVVNGAISGTGTVVGAGKSISWPYFNETAYKIVARGVTRSDGSRAALADTDTVNMDLIGTQAYFTGSNAAALAGAVGIQLVVEYQTWRTMVEFDARSGRASTYFDRYPGCNSEDKRLPNGQVWASCNVMRGGMGCGEAGCGAGAAIKHYFQWGYSDGSYLNGRTYNGTEPENRGAWTGAAQGPCAIGYHIPTQAEWAAAIASAGGTTVALGQKIMLPKSGQVSVCANAFNNDAACAGATNGWYWTSTNINNTNAMLLHNVWAAGSLAPVAKQTPDYAFSVRCIRNP